MVQNSALVEDYSDCSSEGGELDQRKKKTQSVLNHRKSSATLIVSDNPIQANNNAARFNNRSNLMVYQDSQQKNTNRRYGAADGQNFSGFHNTNQTIPYNMKFRAANLERDQLNDWSQRSHLLVNLNNENRPQFDS